MGVNFKKHTSVAPDLWKYTPEYNADGTEKHIHCEGARFHVLSYSSGGTQCSCATCEINKQPAAC